jgi:LmbE family N-acetylglucosaminyl deacetylase
MMCAMSARTHIYVSPHLDDAALSCGGRIWQQVRAGERVLVVMVFAGVPALDTPLSPFARELHAQWGLAADAPLRRREEDREALARLGAGAAYWPYLDCIYRQTPDGHFPYDGEEALFGEFHSAEEGLVAELTGRLSALPLGQGGALYVPLGVGHHVDHQVVRRAAEGLEGVVHYEDYPYAARPEALEAALGAGLWQAELASLSQEALEAKIAAIACYSSQFSTLGWADAAEMAAAVRAFAEQSGGGEPAERYWRLQPPAGSRTCGRLGLGVPRQLKNGTTNLNRQYTANSAIPAQRAPTIQ